jgi:hypothetical protein
MGQNALRAVFNPAFKCPVIAAAIFHMIKGTKAKQAVKVLGILYLVAGKKLAILILKKTVFHNLPPL